MGETGGVTKPATTAPAAPPSPSGQLAKPAQKKQPAVCLPTYPAPRPAPESRDGTVAALPARTVNHRRYNEVNIEELAGYGIPNGTLLYHKIDTQLTPVGVRIAYNNSDSKDIISKEKGVIRSDLTPSELAKAFANLPDDKRALVNEVLNCQVGPPTVKAKEYYLPEDPPQKKLYLPEN